jgi:NitT/TauT family transport system substrate-binding protein
MIRRAEMPLPRPTRRGLLAGAGLALPAIRAHAQPRANLRFAVDWLPQVNHAFAVLALRRGYFAQEAINATVDRGFGSGRTMTDIGAGSLQMAFSDIPTAIQFALRNPQVGVRVVAVIYDGSPLVLTVDGNGPIRSPADVVGRKVAAPDGDAGRQTFPAFARAAGFDAARVEWVTVTPQLREALLARGETQAITGFVTSTQMGLESLGWPAERIRHFRYSDFGLPLFSGGIVTTKRFIDENPAVVRGAVRALLRGLQQTIRDVEDAIAAVKEHEALTDPAVERRRWAIVREQMLLTENVRRNGLSSVDTARMERNIEIVRDTFGIAATLPVTEFWDGSFLPPRDELRLPAPAG